MKKNFKWIVIFVIISIILEGIIFLYNTVVEDLYTKYNFINNDIIDIDFSNNNFVSENDEYETLKLNVSKNIAIYNITMTFKEEYNNNLYVRVRTDYGVKLLPKANYPTTEFKTYYKDGINTDNLQLIFPKNTIKIDSIASIQLNSNLDYMPKINFSVVRCICFLVILLGGYLIFKNRKIICNRINTLKLESMFLLLIIIFGVIYTFVNVPLIRYDEHAHFWRAYELSLGKIKTNPQNEFPKSVIDLFMREDGTYPNREFNYNTVINEIGKDLNVDQKIAFPVGASGGYSIVNYLATTPGVFFARILELSPILILYIGRLFNVFTYALLIYFAIKIAPSKKIKKIIGIISLFPMSINLAASFSPDTIINGFTMLAISFALKLKFDDNIKSINIKQIILFSVLAVIPTICKVVYIFLFGLIFFIPKEKFAKKNSRLIYFILQFLGVTLLYFLLNVVLKGSGQVPIEKNPIEQIIYCVSNPVQSIKILVYTLSSFSTTYLTELVGGWNTPTIFSIILAIILVMVTIEDDKESSKCYFTKIEKVVLIIIAIIEALSVFIALYIDWSTAQASYVMGIQGRYFIPILPILLLGISSNTIKFNLKNKRMKYFTLIVYIYIASIIYSICTFIK